MSVLGIGLLPVLFPKFGETRKDFVEKIALILIL